MPASAQTNSIHSASTAASFSPGRLPPAFSSGSSLGSGTSGSGFLGVSPSKLREPPASPRKNSSVVSDSQREMVGSSSPGKVMSRGMGLREVRERIRKELGDW